MKNIFWAEQDMREAIAFHLDGLREDLRSDKNKRPECLGAFFS